MKSYMKTIHTLKEVTVLDLTVSSPTPFTVSSLEHLKSLVSFSINLNSPTDDIGVIFGVD